MSDEYARKFMGGDRVRFLDKVKMPRWFDALLWGSGAAAVVATAAAGEPVVAGVVATTTFLSWGLMSTIRVAVTDAFVHVQYGLWGPKVALEDIVAVEVIAYEPLRFGGWGIRWSLTGERAYSVPGAGGKAVQLRYRDGTKVRAAVISSLQPEALCAAIDDARNARNGRSLSAVREGLGVTGAQTDVLVQTAEQQHDDTIAAPAQRRQP